MYFEMRSRGALSDGKGNALLELRIEARDVYKTLLYMGDQPRAELQASLGVGELTTRGLLSQMAKEGLITLDGRKPVSLNLSRHSIEFLFPYLWYGSWSTFGMLRKVQLSGRVMSCTWD
ncbi:hypothetical protein [Pseudomonas sp. 34 E 7]|nr:hypothetical protein [Pseudomonas sp. 34 E 7]